jgi:hypothetical protein
VDQDISEALARIEQRQAAYEIVAHRLIGMLEVHNEKLDAILEAATVEPGPSPTAEILKQILTTMQEQTVLLHGLPDAIGEIIREELEAEWEPAEGAFEREAKEREAEDSGPLDGTDEDRP